MIDSGHGAVVESAVPGRVRFRLPQDQRRQDVMGDVESALREIEGVVDVTANPFTGSVLVRLDPAVLSDALLVSFARDAHILSGAQGSNGSEPAAWSETSQLAHSLSGELKRLDHFVSRVSRGTIDGKTAAMFLLLGTSVTRALFDKRQAQAPWYALMWYAYSMFIQWNKNSGGSGAM